MKLLKRILIVLLVIIAIPLIVALFLEKDYAVEREVVINKPKEEVFAYIKYIKNQENYSVWATMDPNMKKSYTGTDGTPGFVAAWESDNDEVGKGEQEIKTIKEGERVDMLLRFKEPMETQDNAYMATEALSANQTKVKWGFTGRMPYPMNFMLLCMDMEGMIGGDLEKGLAKLKTTLEAQN